MVEVMTSADQRRTILRRKYLRLGTGEIVAAAAFIAIAVTSVSPRLAGQDARWALWAALIPLVIVPVQAGGYWLLARSWLGRRPMPSGSGLAGLYRTFRAIDPILLLAGLVGVITWIPDQPLMAS